MQGRKTLRTGHLKLQINAQKKEGEKNERMKFIMKTDY